MSSIRVSVLLVSLSLLAFFGSTQTLAQGQVCPTEQGACFMALGGEDFLFLFDGVDADNDGDEDYVVWLFDGVNDWIRQNPDGSLSYHFQNQSHDLVYCPFHIEDGPPNDECVYGTGKVTGNGTFGGPLGTCPGKINVRQATGTRPSDGAVFTVGAELHVVASNCEADHKFSISAERVD